ncbi:Uncharacterised protein [Mycobacteroides abscessus subsp. abscessus]|nr:Uncharacterised protein [Mycobacteroides abscessus subsp. abscessus]
MSNPAASPSGAGKRTPNTSVPRIGSVGAQRRFSNHRVGVKAAMARRAANTRVCTRSGGTRKNSRSRIWYSTTSPVPSTGRRPGRHVTSCGAGELVGFRRCRAVHG